MQGETELFRRAANLVDSNIKREFTSQGHHLTGAWEKSVTSTVVVLGGDTGVEGFASFYGSIVDAGTSPVRIPFGGTGNGSGTGTGTSKYIQGLFNYFKLRGLGEKDALRAAFATAHVQKKEGMSTIGSRAYSSTGQRQRFIKVAEKAMSVELDNLVLDGYDLLINKAVNEPAEKVY